MRQTELLITLQLCWSIWADSLGSQQYVISNGPSGGMDERIVAVNSDGSPSAFSGHSTGNCIVHLGCFQANASNRPINTAGTPSLETPFDHAECFSLCTKSGMKIAAVSGQNCACAFALTTSFKVMMNVSACNYPCSLCGGPDDMWSVFMCYTYEQLSSLAVDPFRNIAFKTVSINWMMEGEDTSILSLGTETHYLFASDLTSGAPLLEYQMRQYDPSSISDSVFFGALNFDVDSSRLVGLMLNSPFSNSEQPPSYKLVVISINSTVLYSPVLTVTSHPIFTDSNEQIRADVMLGDPANGIISRDKIQTFVFSIPVIGGSSKSNLIFVDISPESIGKIFFNVFLDCIPTQLAINEYYGDVAILATRQGSVQFIAIATVLRETFTGRLAVQSYWDPTGVDLKYVAAITDTQNLNLIAGVSASIPMQNQSCHGIMLFPPSNGGSFVDDRQLLLNQPASSDQARNQSIPSVVCFDIRRQGFFQLWGSVNGTARTVDNGHIDTAVSMNIFSTDPGFPMTLARPEMTLCEISATALSLTIKFDSVTLMGARGIDTNHDGIPDVPDYSTQITSPVDVEECFSASSLGILKGATCYFSQGDILQVKLDRKLSLVSVNDALCLKPNFVCRNQGAEWSPYAAGCCSVSLPPGLANPKPVVIATPSMVVDVCSDLILDLSNSQFCGRGCQFNWTLVSIVPSSPAQYSSVLSAMLADAGASVRFPSATLARSCVHTFNVTVTSSWKTSSTTSIVVEKLAEPAPTVSIPGESRIVQTQMNDYSITALGKISGCNSTASSAGGRALAYAWTFTNCSVNVDKLGILSFQNVIHIPSGSHVCRPGIVWMDKSINKVVCEQCRATVSVFLEGSRLQNSTASISVQIVKSSVVVKCLNPDTAVVTRGPVWFLNCANSVDLDDPSAAPFQGNFFVTCFDSSAKPCFPMTDMPACLTDFTQARVEGDGGAMYPQVILTATQGFCRLSRGIFAINTNLLQVGKYTFKVSITHFDGLRSADKEIAIELSYMPMPKISMALYGPQSASGKYPVSSSLSAEASAALDPRARDVKYSWSLLAKQLNRDYDANAAQRAASRGDTYNVSQYMYATVSRLDDCKAQNKALWTSSSPTLLIFANCLEIANQYAIRLNISWTQSAIALASYSELYFSTANGPPRGGFLGVSQTSTTCDFPKSLTADDWASEDTPLKYRFGYLVNGSVKYWFTDSAQPLKSFTGLVPCGKQQEGYLTTVFVQVVSSAGESTYVFHKIQSQPPPGSSAAAVALIQQAQTVVSSNPTQAFSQVMTAVTMLNDTESLETVSSLISQTQCSSADCGNRVLVVLNSLGNATDGTKLLGAVEANLFRMTSADPATVEQSQTVLNSLSSVLSGLGIGAAKPLVTRSAKAATRVNRGPLIVLSDELSTSSLATCTSVFCEKTETFCIQEDSVGHTLHTCCDLVNHETNCLDPPCWFASPQCSDDVVVPYAPVLDRSVKSLFDVEEGPLSDSRVLRNHINMKQKARESADQQFTEYTSLLRDDIKNAILKDRMSALLKEEAKLTETAAKAALMFDRVNKARHEIALKLIPTLIKDQPPLIFHTDTFTLYIGKTTDMSSALPAFAFPPAFTVPKNSPDSPTSSNPVTGFSYVYVEYKADVFAWALNAPSASAASSVVSLEVMKADPSIPLVVSPLELPFRVFAHDRIFATGSCRMFNLTAMMWTGVGAVNDDSGCLISQWGDVGLFIDPDVPTPKPNWVTSSVDNEVKPEFKPNFFSTSVAASLLLVHVILILWARKLDLQTVNHPRSILLDGDGITCASTINDPIAYTAQGSLRFHFQTFINVLERRHILTWPVKFHPIELRPFRVTLGFILVSTSLALCALLLEVPAGSGALGFTISLISYLIYLCFRSAIESLPHPARHRAIKGVRRGSSPFRRGQLGSARALSPRLTQNPLMRSDLLHAPTTEFESRFDLMPVGSPVRILRSPRENSLPPPPPPPPLDEDERRFIRRIHHVYTDKSSREHEKELIAADSGDSTSPVSQELRLAFLWIANISMVAWILMCMIAIPLKTIYHDTVVQEPAWIIASSVAITVSIIGWDTLACAIIAIIAIGKYRKRVAAHIPSKTPVFVPSAPPLSPPFLSPIQQPVVRNPPDSIPDAPGHIPDFELSPARSSWTPRPPPNPP